MAFLMHQCTIFCVETYVSQQMDPTKLMSNLWRLRFEAIAPLDRVAYKKKNKNINGTNVFQRYSQPNINGSSSISIINGCQQNSHLHISKDVTVQKLWFFFEKKNTEKFQLQSPSPIVLSRCILSSKGCGERPCANKMPKETTSKAEAYWV